MLSKPRVLGELKEIVIMEDPIEPVDNNEYERQEETIQKLLTSLIDQSTILEKLDICMYGPRDDVKMRKKNTTCTDPVIVWNMPRLKTLSLQCSKIPRLVVPSLITAKLYMIRDDCYVTLIMNDLCNAKTIDITFEDNTDDIGDNNDTGTRIDTSDYLKYDDNVPIVSVMPFTTKSLSSNRFSPGLLQSMSRMRYLTHLNIEMIHSMTSPPSYEVLSELLSNWPFIERARMYSSRQPIDVPLDSLTSSSSSSSITLLHLTSLHIYGWNQRLANRLICPNLNDFGVGKGYHDNFNSAIRKSESIDMTQFLTNSPMIVNLMIGHTFKLVEQKQPTCELLPMLNNLLIALEYIEPSSMTKLMLLSPKLTRISIRTNWKLQLDTLLMDALTWTTPVTLRHLSLIYDTFINIPDRPDDDHDQVDIGEFRRHSMFDNDHAESISRIIARCSELAVLTITKSPALKTNKSFTDQLQLMRHLMIYYE
jgi:hypothetical protein